MSTQSFLEQLRVLVVDDNAHMIKIVKTILRGFGVKQFVEARDAAEAFNHLRNRFVNLIIVDYHMSMLDGAEFVRMIRTSADIPNPTVPIIMLTAYSDVAHVVRARDAGVTEFCCKPITAAELWRKLSACFSNPREFVQGGRFAGPDRRRRAAGYSGPDRRGSAGETAPPDGGRGAE